MFIRIYLCVSLHFCGLHTLTYVSLGDDLYGRKLIVIYACKLPSNKVFDQQRLLQ